MRLELERKGVRFRGRFLEEIPDQIVPDPALDISVSDEHAMIAVRNDDEVEISVGLDEAFNERKSLADEDVLVHVASDQQQLPFHLAGVGPCSLSRRSMAVKRPRILIGPEGGIERRIVLAGCGYAYTIHVGIIAQGLDGRAAATGIPHDAHPLAIEKRMPIAQLAH